MCCSKEVVMNQKSALNKESYASCLIVGIMALLCLFPFWVAVVNSFASENSVTLNGYSIIPKELSLDALASAVVCPTEKAGVSGHLASVLPTIVQKKILVW